MLTKKLYQMLIIICLVALATGVFTPTSVHDARCHPLDLTCANYLRPFSQTPTPEKAWGETGATVVPLAAQIMSVRNPSRGEELTPIQKKYLRPLFKGLVDRVKIVYNAKLLDRWSNNGRETHIGGIDSSAQTYCDRIYVRDSLDRDGTDRLVLLAHELTHVQQCHQAGSLSKFGAEYFRGYYRGGETYSDNPLEKSARAKEAEFAKILCDKLGCPPTSGRYYVNYKGWGLNLPVKIVVNS
jgi:hypothetical protein